MSLTLRLRKKPAGVGSKGRRLTPTEAAQVTKAREAKQRKAEHERQRALRRREYRPPVVPSMVGVPGDWARATTAHLCSVYPFHADTGFGVHGVLMGANVTGGGSAFYYDGFSFYEAGHLTNPNIFITGDIGTGKSATAKALIRRTRAVYGASRYVAIMDPKGEYGDLATDMGLTTIKLRPNGTVRINPMDMGSSSTDLDEAIMIRQQLARQLIAAMLGRPLDAIEDAVLDSAIDQLSHSGQPFTLRDVQAAVANPTPELVQLTRRDEAEVARAATPVALMINKLCERSLKGMFDGETNIDIDFRDGAGIVLDLSEVYDNPEAFPLVMLAATVWLREALRNVPGRKSLQVVDEAWAAVRFGAAYFQSSLKLARTHGVATMLIVHKPSDLSAQMDDGTATAKIAQGLLSDIQTRILLRQPPDQRRIAAELFDLTAREQQWIGMLHQGRAIWRIRERTAVVQTILTPGERALFHTDQAMRIDTGLDTAPGVSR